MKEWTCAKCRARISEIEYDYDLHALIVQNGKTGYYHGEIIPATIEQMREDHKALDNGGCPICDEWEDGNGNLVADTSLSPMAEHSSY